MRILHISKYYSPYIGGVENICKYLVEGCTNHETAVVCFNEKHQDIIDKVNGHTVYRVGTWVNIARQALSPTYFKVLRRAIKEFKPDVIQFHWANPFPAAVLLCMIPKHVKLIVHWHMDIIKQKQIYPLIKPIETALLKRADLVIVTSPSYRDASIPLQPFKEKVKILPNAMDEDNFILNEEDFDKIKNLKKQYDNKPIVFFVGRHIQYKGLPHLIEAERYVTSDCVFVIAGNGPLTKELKQKCQSKRVFFVGRLSDEELKIHHYAASIFAFPSITKNEAFGVALAEAMYCETPTVTFTIPGSGVNWVSPNGESGIEVPNGDDKAFAEAIDHLLCNKDMSKQMSINGRKRVKEMYTIPVMVNTMEEYYEELINK
ncbi:glycosyltransferase [Phocaeicola plebeius]|uniref:glycosyltransferase n=1 Tax=Phocaeicola plebeius TaxID=310297 RepID=UPI003562AF0A